jgi:methylenetetrahydrofolate dehydrogenase (NADP+) / methenyltetrahydrofolate cyclohydrolase
MLLSGKSVAQQIFDATQLQIEKASIKPGLGVILVGDDAPSHLYVSIKEKKAHELGMHFVKKVFPTVATEQEVVEAIQVLNGDSKIQGIIVQLPLPKHLDVDRIIAAIEPTKDTDGFHPETIRKFLAGDHDRLPVFPRAMMELVKSVESATRTNGVALVNSDLMGQVLSQALQDEGLESEYILRENLATHQNIVQQADVILTATGEAESFSTLDCKMGAIVIDGGISYDNKGRVIGDVARDDGVYREDISVTPVPGGVGPVTVAVLLARVTEAAFRQSFEVAAEKIVD